MALADFGRFLMDVQNEPALAAKYLKRALMITPNNEGALYNLGTLEANAKLYDDAEKTFGKLIKLRPRHGGCLRALGQLAWARNKDRDAAVSYYEQAERAMPANAEFVLEFAALLLKSPLREDHDRAERLKERSRAIKVAAAEKAALSRSKRR